MNFRIRFKTNSSNRSSTRKKNLVEWYSERCWKQCKYSPNCIDRSSKWKTSL